jgi:hypothetical protein
VRDRTGRRWGGHRAIRLQECGRGGERFYARHSAPEEGKESHVRIALGVSTMREFVASVRRDSGYDVHMANAMELRLIYSSRSENRDWRR